MGSAGKNGGIGFLASGLIDMSAAFRRTEADHRNVTAIRLVGGLILNPQPARKAGSGFGAMRKVTQSMMSLRFRLATLAFLLSSPAFAVDTSTEPPPPDLAALMSTARAAIYSGDYAGAMIPLQTVIVASPQNADALNLLGFASRKTGDLDSAARYYDAALAANPNHLGALEYQGELFILLGDIAAAEANLARLAAACGACDEHAELAEALAGS